MPQVLLCGSYWVQHSILSLLPWFSSTHSLNIHFNGQLVCAVFWVWGEEATELASSLSSGRQGLNQVRKYLTDFQKCQGHQSKGKGAMGWWTWRVEAMAKSPSRKDVSEIVTSDLRTEWCENVSRRDPGQNRQASVLGDSVGSCFLWPPWTIAHQALLSMGILLARILEWVAMPSSRGSSQARDWTQVSGIAGRFCPVREDSKYAR